MKRSPRFVYPAYAVYPEDRDEEAYEPILASLTAIASALGVSGSGDVRFARRRDMPMRPFTAGLANRRRRLLSS